MPVALEWRWWKRFIKINMFLERHSSFCEYIFFLRKTFYISLFWLITRSFRHNAIIYFLFMFNFFFAVSRIGLRSALVLLPMLGVTWLFGLLGNLGTHIGYVFDIVIALQVSFMCHECTQVRVKWNITLNQSLSLNGPLNNLTVVLEW